MHHKPSFVCKVGSVAFEGQSNLKRNVLPLNKVVKPFLQNPKKNSSSVARAAVAIQVVMC